MSPNGAVTYPDNCLRGINNKNAIRTDGPVPRVDTEVFNSWTPRETGGYEQSINWEDDDGAVPFTLAQKRRDNVTIQFPGGIAVLGRVQLDEIMKLPAIAGILSYERKIENNNPYHGNLLLTGSVSKPHRARIAGTLALAVSQIIQP